MFEYALASYPLHLARRHIEKVETSIYNIESTNASSVGYFVSIGSKSNTNAYE